MIFWLGMFISIWNFILDLSFIIRDFGGGFFIKCDWIYWVVVFLVLIGIEVVGLICILGKVFIMSVVLILWFCIWGNVKSLGDIYWWV